MEITIDGLKINYETSGEGKDILILHGWGVNIGTVRPIIKALDPYFKVWALDLPGFGGSAVPPEDWDVYSYADFIVKFAGKVGISNPILIGHSFGGRISIILAAKKMLDINKMILTGSAGVKPKHGADYYLKVYSYKLMKKAARCIGAFSKTAEEKIKGMFGSEDYKNANPVMRKIMVKVVNEDLTYLMPDIKASTLLIWGENDDATPVSDGKLMEKLIPDAGLVVLSGAGHFSYLDKPGDFNVIANKFLENDRG